MDDGWEQTEVLNTEVRVSRHLPYQTSNYVVNCNYFHLITSLPSSHMPASPLSFFSSPDQLT